MENSQQGIEKEQVSLGNVYVMRHSFFSDVIRIGCTPEDPHAYAKSLSTKTPGNYTLLFSLQCNNPCQVKKKIKAYLNAQDTLMSFIKSLVKWLQI